MRPFAGADVKKVFQSYPAEIRRKLLALRELVFETAESTQGVGELTETLKWGEPAYVTEQTKSGSTVRIDWKKSHPDRYCMYFHCQTNLIETFRTLFPQEFQFDGNRAIVFRVGDEIPKKTLGFCIASALTYHTNRSRTRRRISA